ncbi:hypothetical protein GCM10011390_03040 [Aureimonas endophytica]|uniref:Uncharacterized protein n=1 Tax=Aureimonas endophytica TaxID=2027858 RepID=A0A916ZC26_9HYPH|nr:hypothetical protein [Aureimonas endophytica]GGD87702.1 hypothetical protein GCM10011390_03040 [Aureimonas endophytica]
MLDRMDMATVTRRLLSAVLLCLSVVLSQMAHADVPSIPPMHDVEVAQGAAASADEDAAVEHHAAGHSHGDRDDGTSKADDHTGPSDTKCASHCPSVFVPTESDDDRRDWMRQGGASIVHASLTGLPGALAERPPRT